MTTKRATRTPDQQLALERKFGIGLLAGLFAIFCAVLSAKVGGFGWGEKTVEVNLGDGNPSDVVGYDQPKTDASGATGRPRSPYTPPQVFLPPAPPPVVGHYPLPDKPSVAVVPPKPTNPSPPPVADRYAPTTAVAATPPAIPTAPAGVVPAAPTQREPGVAAIGLVAGSEPIRTPIPAASYSAPAFTAPTTHVFADGDNFWLIAQKAYGDGAYYRALFAFNQDRYPHPEDLRPGDTIDVPSMAELQRKFPQLCPAPAGAIQR